jgi:PRTRC genetic system ThiF family protein
MTAPNRKNYLPPRYQNITIMGVGGTGSYLAQGLAKMVAGYRLDLNVTLVDPDTIEEKNCSRQNFHPWEIGQPKATALAYRLNQQYGVNFGAIHDNGNPALYTYSQSYRLLITCVDTISARKPLKDCGQWLDLGNGFETGQALFGTTSDVKKLKAEAGQWAKTPIVGHLPGPYLLAGMSRLRDTKKKQVSCADTPFAEQGIFANEWAAAAGLTILHQLLIKGELKTPAIYFDASRGLMASEYITRDYLARITGKEK